MKVLSVTAHRIAKRSAMASATIQTQYTSAAGGTLARGLLGTCKVFAAGLLVATLASSAPAVAAPASPAAAPASPAAARTLAAQSAAALVTSRPAALQASPNETFVQGGVVSAGGTHYVPYERTYAGLPVVGGDFVVVVDNAGQVVFNSVALKRPIGNVFTTPTLTQAAAEAVAAKQLRTVSKVEGTQLVVHALDASAHLAWETTVQGVGANGYSRLTVDVDAATGAVLRVQEHVMSGTGTSAWSGPNPVALNTTHSGSTFSMRDPAITNLSCQDAANNSVFSGPDDLWGNGNATSRETGCVDALFGVQTEAKMLTQWLGRNGMDGAGGAWPIRVGLADLNAFYDGTQVQVGHNSANQWIGSLDVIGHEMGHGIDDHTPGGLSKNGTQEFIADTFGAATEWFANEPAGFDVPDFTVGERINLTGNGPIRNMFNPSALGHPNCYSASVPTSEVHAAAGPGNHWFYLLAEGTQPSNGQPTSPTCNQSTVVGLGIESAIKILYNAMLMKTSASSYLSYRTWTLQAAKNVFPASCGPFNTVKAAWDAVSVPAQPSDPTCQASDSPVILAPDNDEKLDLNGDGLADICGRRSDGVYCALSTGTGFANATLWSPFFNDANDWNLGRQFYSTIHYPDLNNDGRADICGRGRAGIYCAISTGTSFGNPTLWETAFSDANDWNAGPEFYSTIHFPDLNNDGRADVCGRGRAGVFCELSNGSSFDPVTRWTSAFSDLDNWNVGPQYYSTIEFPDVNHDGRADICGRGRAGVFCALSTGTSFGAATQWESSFNDVNQFDLPEFYTTMHFPDLNNDGRADICTRGRTGVFCELSTGTSFGAPTLWTTAFKDADNWNAGPQYYATIQFPDVNNDGRADICGRGAAGVFCAISTGSAFGNATGWDIAFSDANQFNLGPEYYSTIRFPDLNHDGRADVCGRGKAGIFCEISNGGSFVSTSLWSSFFSDLNSWNLGPQFYSTIRFP